MDMEEIIEEVMGILMATGICVVLPLMIVWMVNKRKRHELDKKTEIMMTVLEKHPDLDPAEVMNKLDMQKKNTGNKSLKQDLLEKLLTGCMCLLIGLVLLFTHLFHIIFLGDRAVGIVGGGVVAAVGIAFIIYYFVGKKVLNNEIEAEEKRLNEQ